MSIAVCGRRGYPLRRLLAYTLRARQPTRGLRSRAGTQPVSCYARRRLRGHPHLPAQIDNCTDGGFTRGRPWERLADDSLDVTVEAQDSDSSSLLQFNRRMIHLRDVNRALARGRIVPLTASSDAIAAFARRDGDRVVLVIANLSGATIENVSLASATGALPAGRWQVRSLLGGGAPPTLRVGRDGRIDGYVPLPSFGPAEFHLFELAAATQGH